MKKILVIQHKMIGDVLTSTIILETLRKNFPDVELHYLVNKNTVAVVKNNPFIDKLIVFTPKETKFTIIKNNIKNEKYYAVIDVYSKMKSAFLTFFSNAPYRIGIYKNYLRIFYSHPVKHLKVSVQNMPLAFENRFNLLKPLKIIPDYTITPKIYITKHEKDTMLQVAKNNHLFFEKHDYIMVSILGSEDSKTYPLNYMAKLLDISAQTSDNFRFLLNYIPSQEELVKELLSKCSKNTLDKISPFYAKDLRDFMVLTSFCRAVIGNEGGAINMAKALDVSTFAIFSPWVRIETWGNIQNKNNQNVHLKDYKPELFKKYKQKEFKKRVVELYQEFSPELFSEKLVQFLNNHKTK